MDVGEWRISVEGHGNVEGGDGLNVDEPRGIKETLNANRLPGAVSAPITALASSVKQRVPVPQAKQSCTPPLIGWYTGHVLEKR